MGQVRIPKVGWLLIGLFALMVLGALAKPQDRSTVTRRDVKFPLHALTFKAGGRTFGLNGTALMRGAERVDPIWTPNPAIPSSYMSIGPVQERARALCQ